MCASAHSCRKKYRMDIAEANDTCELCTRGGNRVESGRYREDRMNGDGEGPI